MREDDEHEDDRHPLAVVEQSVWKRHHRKPLNASLGFLYHRVDDLPAPCSHLFDVLYGHLPSFLLGIGNSHKRHLIRLMLRVRRAVSQLLDLFEHTYAEVFGSVPYGEQGAVFVLTAPVASENYISLLGGWKDAKERHYMLCVGVGKSQRDDAKNVVNALTESVSKLRLPGSSAILGWTADKSARFSARPVPSVKRESLLSELLYRVVYRGNSRIGICASCGSPFIQDETGPLRDVCSQACRMTLRRRNGLA